MKKEEEEEEDSSSALILLFTCCNTAWNHLGGRDGKAPFSLHTEHIKGQARRRRRRESIVSL